VLNKYTYPCDRLFHPAKIRTIIPARLLRVTWQKRTFARPSHLINAVLPVTLIIVQRKEVQKSELLPAHLLGPLASRPSP
jgi:hypothetical protein